MSRTSRRLKEEEGTLKIIENDLEYLAEVDVQLSGIIKMLENGLAMRMKLRDMRRHTRELSEEYQGLGFVEEEWHHYLVQQVVRLANFVEAGACNSLCTRQMRKKGQQQDSPVPRILQPLLYRLRVERQKVSNNEVMNWVNDELKSFADIKPYPLVYSQEEEEEEQRTIFNKVYNFQGYVSILGDEGESAKTDVASKIYKAAQDHMEFQIYAWVAMKPEYHLKDVCTAIVQQQQDSSKIKSVYTNLGVENIDEVRDMGSQLLFEKVNRWLASCSFIIVLNDVGSEIWSTIKSHNIEWLFPLKGGGLPSTVIFTTSDVQAASQLTRVIEVVKPLSFEDGWALFTNTMEKDKIEVDAPTIKEEVDEVPSSINEKELLKGIVSKISEDLPLAITMLPRLYLINKLRYYKEESSSSSAPATLIICHLQYQMLPPRIRLCYLYMALFPQTFEIPIRRILRLWVAEGLVLLPDHLQSSKTPEDLAMSYLMELEKRKMISVGLNNGRRKTCRIPPDMHKFFLTMAMRLGSSYVHKASNNTPSMFSLRRLAEHDDIESYTTSEKEDFRSYISFNTRKRDTPAQQVGVFLQKLVAKNNGFGLLRVLDLESVYKPSLPSETLGKLFLLIYLGLRWTFLDSLPDSVGTLQYLEILDVKHTNISKLPSTIWKAKNLKHIYMNQVHFDMYIKKSFTFTTSLTNLQTLRGLSIGSNSHVVKWLSKLSSLRKLGLTYIYNPTSAEGIADWVSKLTNLQSLKLRSIDESGQPSDLKFPDMTRLHKLSELYLMGVLSYLNAAPEQFRFTHNLEVLTLTGSNLIGDYPIRTLGMLPKLTILRFYGHSYSGSRIIIKEYEFPQLVVMKLWMLEELEKLEIQKGAMSNNLQELDIRCCPNLKHVKGLAKHQLDGLQKITLTNMPADFVQKVESEVEKGHVDAQVQQLNLSPISTTTSKIH